MGREENIEVFRDTIRLYSTDAFLSGAIRSSIEKQVFFSEKESLSPRSAKKGEGDCEIILSGKRTLEAASYYAYKGKRVAILNFASATNPGGGVERGASAQEEAICRISTLFPSISDKRMMDSFYTPHRVRRNPLHNDDAIYTPGVVVFKSDTRCPVLLPKEEWYQVDIISSAAPNLRGCHDSSSVVTKEQLFSIHEKRIRRVLDIAIAKGDEVVILGAFGCGVFSNPPEIVAKAMKSVISEYRKRFSAIEIAVYTPPYDDTNYRVFRRVFESQ